MTSRTDRSSGDLIADRRYAWAEAAFKEGDAATAAELAAQTLDLAPDFAPAHALLGRARLGLGEREAAVAALQQALALEPDDALGVRLDLAQLGALAAEDAVSAGYVRALFDEYAPRFDRHLTRDLHYRAPELLREAVEQAARSLARPARFRRALDLGCGTGLVAAAFAGATETIAGVDLSPGMLAKARRTRLYARLHEGELVAFLRGEPAASADLVVAADVFVYLAALDAVFREVRRVLARDGLFAFTVQAHEGDGVVLGEDARYAHGEPVLRRWAEEAGLSVERCEAVSTRQDRQKDVPGFLVVLRPDRPGGAGG